MGIVDNVTEVEVRESCPGQGIIQDQRGSVRINRGIYHQL